MRILLYFRDVEFLSGLESSLKSIGHNVVSTSDLEAAKSIAVQACLDLVLVECGRGCVCGEEVFEFVSKRVKNIYKIAAIEADLSMDRLTKMYALGCSDHIKAPFSKEEFILKIENLEKTVSKQIQRHIILGKNYKFDKSSPSLFFGDEIVPLTKKQSEIMYLLVSNLGSVVDFDKLRENVWSNEPVDNPTIRAEIGRLKKSLKEEFIQNIRGIGYMIKRSE